jgi:hypothetical protein
VALDVVDASSLIIGVTTRYFQFLIQVRFEVIQGVNQRFDAYVIRTPHDRGFYVVGDVHQSGVRPAVLSYQ